MVLPLFGAFIFDRIFFIPADKEDSHKSVHPGVNGCLAIVGEGLGDERRGLGTAIHMP